MEMDWKEELVLQFRELAINQKTVVNAMSNFVDVFNRNITKYGIKNIEAETDSQSYIDIKGYKRIILAYSDDGIVFSIMDENGRDDIVFIRLRIVKEAGMYLINYVNTKESEAVLLPFIDENTIDGIFRDLIRLNKKHLSIKG